MILTVLNVLNRWPRKWWIVQLCLSETWSFTISCQDFFWWSFRMTESAWLSSLDIPSFCLSPTSSAYSCRCREIFLHPITLKDTYTHTHTHTNTHTYTLDRTTLHEGSAQPRDLYLTTHNTPKRLTSMSLAGIEPTIPTGERPQAYALHRAATGIDQLKHDSENLNFNHFCRNSNPGMEIKTGVEISRLWLCFYHKVHILNVFFHLPY